MIEWVLILALAGGYELQGAYKTEAECEKAGMEMMAAKQSIGKRAMVACYKKFSVMTSNP
ncbi:hypothetical protein ACCD10_27765 [Pseudomonas sp. Pseusp122]|uniref:hypothetical protein n=1 Tax=unclassified Pseudomonas TaxID=196821 RepID=UPI0039A618ED